MSITHPRVCGCIETDFPPAENEARNHVRHGAPQHPLRRAAMQLELEAGVERESHDTRIGYRHPRLETVRHRHAVVLLKQSSEVRLAVPVQNLVARLPGRRSIDPVLEHGTRSPARDELLGWQQLQPLRLRNFGEVFEVAGPPAACADGVGDAAEVLGVDNLFEQVSPDGMAGALRLGAARTGEPRREYPAGLNQGTSRIPAEDF